MNIWNEDVQERYAIENMDSKDHTGANQEPHEPPREQNMEPQDHPGASQEAQWTPRQQNIGNLDPLDWGAGGMRPQAVRIIRNDYKQI